MLADNSLETQWFNKLIFDKASKILNGEIIVSSTNSVRTTSYPLSKNEVRLLPHTIHKNYCKLDQRPNNRANIVSHRRKHRSKSSVP